MAAMDRAIPLLQLAARNPQGQLELKDWKKFSERLQQDDIKDHFVCVIGIIGKFREGKSTLLNIFHRYLLQQMASGLLDTDSYLYELSEHAAPFVTSHESDGCTQGIWISKDPYYFLHQNCERYAVFLMDTQGLMDTQNTDVLDSSLFLLTSMISLFTIFNVMRKVGQEHLNMLAQFSSIASKIHSSFYNGDGAVFQHLIVLNRDTQGSDLEPGWEYGQLCLQKWFATPQNAEILHTIQRVFRSMKCFLLPKIAAKGSDADDCAFTLSKDSKSYETAEALKVQHYQPPEFIAISVDFRDHITDFLDRLFGGLLSPFEQKSTKMSSQKYAELIEHIGELFVGGQIPSVQNMLQMMIRMELESAITTAFQTYRENIVSIIREAVDDMDLLRHHADFKDECKGVFCSRIPVIQDEPDRCVTWIQKLDEQIEQEFRFLREQNHARVVQIRSQTKDLDALTQQLYQMQEQERFTKAENESTTLRLESEIEIMKEEGHRERQGWDDEMLASRIRSEERSKALMTEIRGMESTLRDLRDDISKHQGDRKKTDWLKVLGPVVEHVLPVVVKMLL